jgi:metallo-beta-lactamase family protein
MFNDDFAVKAKIETLGGFSAHAGQDELLDWIRGFETNPCVVLVHGEPKALDVLRAKLWSEHNIRAKVPRIGESMVF